MIGGDREDPSQQMCWCDRGGPAWPLTAPLSACGPHAHLLRVPLRARLHRRRRASLQPDVSGTSNVSVSLDLYPSVCLSVSVSVCLIWLSVCLCVCLPVCLHVPSHVSFMRPTLAGSNCLRPYHTEHARSRPISEAKQCRAWLVLGWETAWEYQVL